VGLAFEPCFESAIAFGLSKREAHNVVDGAPGIPERPERLAEQTDRHRLPVGHRVVSTSVLGGLHHEYRLERAA